jgi:FlaA1/EpsC-like NDP-sugar epimerase
LVRRAIVMGVHASIFALAYFMAWGLRFDFDPNFSYAGLMFQWFALILVLRLGAFQTAGLFNSLWKYSSVADLKAIALATTGSTLLFAAAQGFLFSTFPRSVIAIDWMLCILLAGGARFSYRILRADAQPPVAKDVKPVRLIIVGAGDAGESLLREIQRNHAARYDVEGFVDDAPEKAGAHIHGIRVIGTVDRLASIVRYRAIDEIVIAAPASTGPQMRRIVDHCKASGARFRTIPGMDQLIEGRVTLSQVRNVDIEDLLGRDPVALDMQAIGATVEGQVVMVTGAGGSIGSELCRQLCRFNPRSLLLVERAENSLFNIHRELVARGERFELVPLMADVADAARMDELFARHRPTLVVHAAAHKHVPMMEWNPGEAVKNNVLGTRTLADAADRHGVGRFVMVSTDKAVNPTSVMGASKRVAEIYVQSLSRRSKTKFVTVRFGNVLGSAGSVIPIFKEQIAAGGPITVTHPEMRRYFMTIPEASQLVLQAGTMGDGGEIFILDMGQPVKIADLARDLITLSGLTVGVDVDIKFTGMRPGEKLFEELSVDDESAEKTRHPKIFVGRMRVYDQQRIEQGIAWLAAGVGEAPVEVRARFADLVPEYHCPEDGLAAVRAHEAAAGSAGAPLVTPVAPVAPAVPVPPPAGKFRN